MQLVLAADSVTVASLLPQFLTHPQMYATDGASHMSEGLRRQGVGTVTVMVTGTVSVTVETTVVVLTTVTRCVTVTTCESVT